MGNIDGIAQGLDHMDLVGMNKFANNLAVPILMIAHTDGADLGQVGIGQTEEGRAMARCPAPENNPRFFVAMIFGGLAMMDAPAIRRIGLGEGDDGPRKTRFVLADAMFKQEVAKVAVVGVKSTTPLTPAHTAQNPARS